jgi:midasin
VRSAFEKQEWPVLVRLLSQSLASARAKLEHPNDVVEAEGASTAVVPPQDTGAKRKAPTDTTTRKSAKNGHASSPLPDLDKAWAEFAVALGKFQRQAHQVKTSFAFWFAEGCLVKALREGRWLLLDEINLASSETLERLTSVLEGTHRRR